MEGNKRKNCRIYAGWTREKVGGGEGWGGGGEREPRISIGKGQAGERDEDASSVE